MLSKQIIQDTLTSPARTQQIYAQNCAGAFIRLNSIIVYLKLLYLIQKVVFYLLPSQIRTLQYASLTSSLVQYLALISLFRDSIIRGRGCLFFIVTLFKPQQLTYSLILLSFFLVKRIGAFTRDLLYLIQLRAKYLSRYLRKSLSSILERLYNSIQGAIAPSSKLIARSYSL